MPPMAPSIDQPPKKHLWAGALLALLAMITYTGTSLSLEEHGYHGLVKYLAAVVFLLIMALIILVASRGQRRAEKTLHETEKKYFDLLQQAADPILAIDTLGIIRSANSAVERVSGYRPDELTGRHFLKTNVLCKESMNTASMEFLRLLRGEIRPPFELSMTRENGVLFTVEAHARKMRGADGKILVQIILRDITARKKAERIVLQERNNIKKYLNIAGVMILAVDKNESVTLVNKKGCELLGYKEEEIVGQNWFDHFLPHPVVNASRARFQKFMSGEMEVIENSENIILNKNGEERLIAWHNTALSDEKGNITGTLSSGQDITERRRIEDQLHLQSAALEAAANAILIVGRDGKIVWTNPAFTDMTGYTREEAIGQSPRLLKSGLHNASFYGDLWNTVLSGNIWHGEIVNRRKDDQLYTEEMTITPVRNKNNEIQHFIAIKRDITERKRLQQNLEQANRELESYGRKLERALREMAEKNKQLQEAQNQLIQSEKMAAIGVLSSGIAHEIKNPLAIIVLSIEEFEAISDKLDAQSKIYIQMIKRAADRANDVIIELLSFARASELKAENVNVHQLVEGTFLLVHNTAKFKGIALEHKDTGKDIEVTGDRILLEQALFNLLINAVDATERGGTITVETHLRKSYSSFAQQDEAVIKVMDTGSGIDPEILPRIFEPFFTTKEQGKGTGLGLSTVYTLLKRHHGTIDVESTVGVGTTFIITLPLAKK